MLRRCRVRVMVFPATAVYDLRDTPRPSCGWEDAVIARCAQNPGRDVLRKAADELHGRQLHYLVAAVAVVPVAEAHTVFVNGQSR